MKLLKLRFKQIIGLFILIKNFFLVELRSNHLNTPFFHEIASSKSVDRVEHLLKKVRNKRVIHFGFLDIPFTEEKTKSKDLLHNILKNATSYLFGVDVNTKELNLYRDITSDKENICLDITNATDKDLKKHFKESYDYVLFTEVLEHVPNPFKTCVALRNLCILTNSKLLLTVPNAYSQHAFFIAMAGYELVHPDHYYYFSPTTIKKLLSDSGFDIEEFNMCDSKNKMAPGITYHGLFIMAKPI